MIESLYLKATLTALVEGLTEFVPVSSTGHMILFDRWIDFSGPQAETFAVFIQLGAILAALLIYRQQFMGLIPSQGEGTWFHRLFFGESRPTVMHFGVAVVPILIAGLALHKVIKERLFSADVVAYGLIVGGLLMIVVEKLPKNLHTERVEQITIRQAFWVGIGQCLAVWPGMSRSGSTLVTSLLVGIKHKPAADFSFMIAVPVMFAAVSYDLLKSWSFLSLNDLGYFSLGFVIAFGVAWASIRWFLVILGRLGLVPFGLYRILLGGVVLWLL